MQDLRGLVFRFDDADGVLQALRFIEGRLAVLHRLGQRVPCVNELQLEPRDAVGEVFACFARGLRFAVHRFHTDVDLVEFAALLAENTLPEQAMW